MAGKRDPCYLLHFPHLVRSPGHQPLAVGVGCRGGGMGLGVWVWGCGGGGVGLRGWGWVGVCRGPRVPLLQPEQLHCSFCSGEGRGRGSRGPAGGGRPGSLSLSGCPGLRRVPPAAVSWAVCTAVVAQQVPGHQAPSDSVGRVRTPSPRRRSPIVPLPGRGRQPVAGQLCPDGLLGTGHSRGCHARAQGAGRGEGSLQAQAPAPHK